MTSKYRLFDTNTKATLEFRYFDPDCPDQCAEVFTDWPYAAVDWEIATE